MSCVSHCHLAAILPISGRIVSHYRWHPLYGKARVASRLNGAQRHVELAPGVVTVLPVWKLDAAYYADLKVGAPQVSLATLYTNPRRG
jgi:hypothetical protein